MRPGSTQSAQDEKPGWWDGLVGYGKGIDLDRFFVVCVNFPGSPYGTTSPSSIDPHTDKPYGSRYPWPAVEDMVHAEKVVLDHLGITHLRSIAGGSLGGMQVLLWCACHPGMADSIVAMSTGAAVPVEGVAWHVIGRKIIEADPRFNGGDYYDGTEALRGLEVARMVGHMTYLSTHALQTKFGRRRRANTRQFEIDSYFEHQGKKFATIYDANSYVRVQAAMDEMDLEEQYGSLQSAFRSWRGRTLLISFDTDWLFPPEESESVVGAMRSLGIDAQPSAPDVEQRPRLVPDRLRPDHAAGAGVPGPFVGIARISHHRDTESTEVHGESLCTTNSQFLRATRRFPCTNGRAAGPSPVLPNEQTRGTGPHGARG